MIKFKIINMFFKKILLVLNCFFTLHAKKNQRTELEIKGKLLKGNTKNQKWKNLIF